MCDTCAYKILSLELGSNSPTKCSRNEIFSPVFNIVPYDSIDEAIAFANDSCYGLQAAIFTNSLDIASRCAEELFNEVPGQHSLVPVA